MKKMTYPNTAQLRILKVALAFWVALVSHQAIAADFQVPDAALQQCLQELAHTNHWSQPSDFKKIDCHGLGIESAQGLVQFSQIEELSLYNNKLDRFDIDLSQFQSLKTLNLARNNLISVGIADAPILETVYLFSNRIDTLQLANLAELREIKTHNNKIESFHYSNAPKLKKIYIFNNKLKTIDIHNLPNLEYMDCRQNPMPNELYDEMDRMQGTTFLHDGNAEDW